MEFLTVDKLGRVLIPKRMRKEFGLKPGTRLFAVHNEEGNLVLMDIDALARQADKEVEAVMATPEAKAAKEIANREAAVMVERILAGRERPGVRRRGSPARKRDPPARRRSSGK